MLIELRISSSLICIRQVIQVNKNILAMNFQGIVTE